MQYQYNLFFRSRFNLLDSIKLSGGMASAAFKLYPAHKTELEHALLNCELQVSDQFPYLQESKECLFPSPILPYSAKKKGDNDCYPTDRKKSIPFSSIKSIMQVVEEFKKGEITRERAMEILGNVNGNEISRLSYYREGTEYAVSLQEQKPMVYVRELTAAGNISRRDFRGKELLTFDPVYFIAKYPQNEFSVAMDYLEDWGFSGMISRGKGHFAYGRINSELKTDFSGEGYYLIISKYCPSESDFNSIDLDKSYYSISTFTGISNDNSGLPKIRYFNPGSILFLKGEIKGKAILTNSGKRILIFSALKVKVG